MCSIMEWDNFKEEEKVKSYYEYVKKNTPFFEKLHKELGILTSSWSDGSGHVVYITEYPSAETYAKVLNNEEYQKIMTNISRRVLNVHLRTLRPASFIPID